MINAFKSDTIGFRFKKSKMWLSFHFANLNPLSPDSLSEVKLVFDTGASTYGRHMGGKTWEEETISIER